MTDSPETSLAVILTSLEYIKRDIADIKKKLEENYVTREEFNPIKNIVYGMVILVLTSFMGALTFLVFRR